MNDLISRQAAIDAIMGQPPEPHYPSWYAEQIKELPSADNEVNLSEKPTSLKLKPCPFCGGEARLLLNAKRKIYGKDEYRTGVVACCNVCEARMFYGSEKLAIEAWNRRARNERRIKAVSVLRRRGRDIYRAIRWKRHIICDV
jgi:Lar family restriction alleviation protein